ALAAVGDGALSAGALAAGVRGRRRALPRARARRSRELRQALRSVRPEGVYDAQALALRGPALGARAAARRPRRQALLPAGVDARMGARQADVARQFPLAAGRRGERGAAPVRRQ